MYATIKAAAFCAQLFAQQQASLDAYNRFVFNTHDEPMYLVNTSPVALTARRAQLRYEKRCE